MADEPSSRAIWNMRMVVNMIVLIAYFGILIVGVQTGSITTKEALALIGSTALGGGIGWLSK